MTDFESLAALASDPMRFVTLCWPDMRLYDKQRDVLLSVRDNLETFVPAANEMGKTRIAAVIAIWFFMSRTPARVITSSSGETQLSTILLTEIQQLIRTSRIPLPLSIKHLCIRKLADPESAEHLTLDYLIGHVASTVENFQGHHLKHDRPRVLIIFDEASGVSDEFFDASDSWAHRKLVIGNPLSNTNFFYRLCKRGDVEDPAGQVPLLRKVIRISGKDSPNVQAGMRWREAGNEGRPPVMIPGLLSYEEFVRREQEWDEIKKTTRLYGQFYEGDQMRMFPDRWLDLAMDQRRWDQLSEQPRQALTMGVDVASGGRDDTCWTLIDEHGVVAQHVLDVENAMEIVGRTAQLMNSHGVSAECVAFDAGGGGKQIADRLIEQGHYVNTVGFGESADAKQSYRNRRAEMYGVLRDLLNPDDGDHVFALPPDAHELRAELAILPISYDSEGRVLLPPKNKAANPNQTCIRQMLGRSPDRADSLALAAWMLDHAPWDGTIQGELICSFEPGDDIPLSDAEIEELDPFLKDLVLTSRQLDLERKDHRFHRDWDDDCGW